MGKERCSDLSAPFCCESLNLLPSLISLPGTWHTASTQPAVKTSLLADQMREEKGMDLEVHFEGTSSHGLPRAETTTQTTTGQGRTHMLREESLARQSSMMGMGAGGRELNPLCLHPSPHPDLRITPRKVSQPFPGTVWPDYGSTCCPGTSPPPRPSAGAHLLRQLEERPMAALPILQVKAGF